CRRDGHWISADVVSNRHTKRKLCGRMGRNGQEDRKQCEYDNAPSATGMAALDERGNCTIDVMHVPLTSITVATIMSLRITLTRRLRADCRVRTNLYGLEEASDPTKNSTLNGYKKVNCGRISRGLRTRSQSFTSFISRVMP